MNLYAICYTGHMMEYVVAGSKDVAISAWEICSKNRENGEVVESVYVVQRDIITTEGY